MEEGSSRTSNVDMSNDSNDIDTDSEESNGHKLISVHSTPWFRRYGCRAILVLMSFLGCANCYTMRVNLSLAIVAMVNHTAIGEFHKDNSNECAAQGNSNKTKVDGPYAYDEDMQSWILGGFFIGYFFTQIPGGRIAEIYGGKWVFGLGVALTGVFTLLTGVAAEAGFGVLLTLRILEGLAEGVTFPALMVMISLWSKPDERGIMTSFIFNGVKLGTVVSMPLTGLLIKSFGWESVFYVMGSLSLFWFLAWIFLCYSSPEVHPRISESERKDILETRESVKVFPTPWKAILTSVPFYAIVITHIGHAFPYYVSLTQISKYLFSALHFDIEKNGLLSATPYLVSWLVGSVTPVAIDMCISKGLVSHTVGRKIANTVGTLIPGLALLGVAFANCDAVLAVCMLTLAVGANGAIYAGERTAIIDIAPNFAGTIMGVVNMLGSGLFGFVAPKVSGAILQGHSSSLHHWMIVWSFAASFFIAASLVFLVFGSAELQPWNEPAEPEAEGEKRRKKSI